MIIISIYPELFYTEMEMQIEKNNKKNFQTHDWTLYAQCSVFKHRKIIKKGAAAVTTMPGIYLTNYSRVEIFIANIKSIKK